MAFWSTQRIKHEQSQILAQGGKSLVDPYNPDRVGQAAYELSLSTQALVTRSPESLSDQLIRGILYPSKLDRDPECPSKGSLDIHPGQFALIYTNEIINIPKNVLSFISIKAKVKLKGLVNISGFHVDPGYSGRIKFTIYNAGNKLISLKYGEPYFLIWFCELDADDEKPYDRKHFHNGQSGISDDDREQMADPSQSPAALSKKLEDLEKRTNLIFAIVTVVGTIVILPLIISLSSIVFGKWLDSGLLIKQNQPAYIQTNGMPISTSEKP